MAQYALTGAWQKIASAGSTVEVQAAGAFEALLTTSASAPAAAADGVRLSMDTRTYAVLPADLYARTSGGGTGLLEVVPVGAPGGGTVSAADGAVATLGALADAPATADNGAFSVVALLKRSLGYLGSLAGAVSGGAVRTAPQAGVPALDATGPLSAAGDAVAVSAAGLNTGIVMLPAAPAGWSGTAVLEGTANGTYADATPLNAIPYGGGAATAVLNAPGIYEVSVSGLKGIRLRATSAIAGGPVAALVRAANGNKSVRVGAPASNPLPTADINGAAFATAAALTAGTVATPGRSVGVLATAAGTLTLTLAGGGTIALPVGAGWQTFPFAATGFALSGGGAGTVYNLN